MKLITQDGRELELSREYHLSTCSCHLTGTPRVTITLEGEPRKVDSKCRYTDDNGQWHELPDFYWHRDKILEETVGRYKSNVRAHRAATLLNKAWKNGAVEFTVPQDSNELLTDWELFEEFCEEHKLTLVSINELGYKPSDIPRNLQIWKTTDEFERRGIIVADPTGEYDINAFGGAYSTSLKKWQALQKKSRVLEMPKNVRRGYRQVRGLRRQMA